MSRLPWQGSWDPIRDLQREVGRFFEAFEPLHAWRMSRPFPALNLYDAGDRYILTADLPGVPPDSFELSITGDSLVLMGSRSRPEGVAEESYRRQERPFGRWSRSITLPERVASERATAEYANGVLTVVVPKAAEPKPRQIPVSPQA